MHLIDFVEDVLAVGVGIKVAEATPDLLPTIDRGWSAIQTQLEKLKAEKKDEEQK